MTNHWIWLTVWIVLVLAAGIGAMLILRREKYRALGWALLIASVSLAIAGAVLNRLWTHPNLWLVTHIAAGLSLGWMLVCIPLRRHAPKLAGGHDAVDIIQFLALTFGMIAMIVLVYVAVFELAFRIFGYALYAMRPRVVPLYGLYDIAAVAAAALIGLRLTRQRSLGTLLFWLMTLAAVWAGLLVPSVAEHRPGAYAEAVPTRWPIPIMVIASVTIILFVAMHHAVAVRHRRQAWPHQLTNLLEPLESWPGFNLSAALVGVSVLAMGCLFVTTPWTLLAALFGGIAMFLLAYHRWNSNYVEAAMAMMSLAVVSLAMLGIPHSHQRFADYPAILRRALIALSIMVLFWHWMAGVWLQQLDGKRAWTTTGRSIPVALRAGFMVGAIGVFISLQLATWPVLGVTADSDQTRGSWIGGLAGMGLLCLTLLFASLKTRKTALAWLTILALLAIIVFMHFRLHGAEAHLWATRRAPLLLAAAAPFVAFLPRTLRLADHNPYVEVLLITSICVLPIAALLWLFVTEYSQLAGRWITPATTATVILWYLAAFVLYRRRVL